ncbi:MAG: Replicative DNA helicase [Candidatus Uhrbacteria bacterium GW2011_GWF2_44_350]|uniref:Replicative DNA helicase n=1 Tax=Candidatus Uhrbacteria bacterium GW2011_GWF2_44_350 TaxID=1619000 RepID=A0A0G1J8D1_9BACT|nr:MAG: Replicative DNA helicase [Candidatus Uhrbacteria bacterium GW2011_GWF2_44_350]
MNLPDTLLQHKRQAERLFCACVLVIPDNIRHDCGWLDPKSFTDERYSKFWKAVMGGQDQYTAAIDNQIYNDLIDAGLEIVSSFAYPGFAQTIADDNFYLRLAEQAPKLAKTVIDRDKGKAKAIIDNLAKDAPDTGDNIVSTLDVAIKLGEAVEAERRAIKTHIVPLDHALGGFERETLTILAARPSMGKTALAFQFARSAASNGHKVLYCSIEMSAITLWARATCGALEISWRDVLDKNYSKLPGGNLDQFRAEAVNLAAIYNDTLLIDDSGRLTLDMIWQRVARYEPDFLVVDHQGLVSHGEVNPVKRAGMVAWGLKQMGKEFEIPVLMLQQLNRGVETRDNKRPVMSDLRESGELEEIADTVIFIYRDDYYTMPENPPKVSDTELIIAKHRSGTRNQGVRVDYHLPRQWFYRKGDI